MKLTKPQLKMHEECIKILAQSRLTEDEKIFVLDNYYPAYNNQIGYSGMFFTPTELARSFRIEVDGKHIIDLCAGIGMLSFYCLGHHSVEKVTCVELNPEFVAVGKKILPEAEWICADVLTHQFTSRYNCAISNPSYGKIMTGSNGNLKYKGSSFEFKVIEIASKISDRGAFVLPPNSVPFRMSPFYKKQTASGYEKFNKETGIVLEPNCGLDCEMFKNDWKGTKISVEIAVCDF